MKLHEIIKRVQRQFGDDIGSQITEEDIVRWVNAAMLEIAMQANTNQATQKGITKIVAGKIDYVLPPDLLALRAVRFNGRMLKASTFEQIAQFDGATSTTSEDSSFYYTHGNGLCVWPAPAKSEGTIDIYYVKTPDTISVGMDQVEPDVPIKFHPRIVEYCIAQAAELDDNLQHYSMKMQEFSEKVGAASGNGNTPDDDGQYPFITYVNDGW